jgi:hypothetical protein
MQDLNNDYDERDLTTLVTLKAAHKVTIIGGSIGKLGFDPNQGFMVRLKISLIT